MDKYAVVTAKISDEVYKEFALRIPEGERSDFIRDAIMEKLQSVPRPDRLFELEKRIASLEISLNEIKRYLTELEVLTVAPFELEEAHEIPEQALTLLVADAA